MPRASLFVNALIAVIIIISISPVNALAEFDSTQSSLNNIFLAVKQGKTDTISASEKLFDFVEMSKRTLGIEWNKFTIDQRKEFVKLYKPVVLNAWVRSIKPYDKIEFLGEQRLSDTTTGLKSKMSKGSIYILVDYWISEKNGTWLIHDISSDGESYVRYYRDQFKGVQAESVLAMLRQKESVSDQLPKPVEHKDYKEELVKRGGPTGRQIHSAIQRSLASEVPVSWVGNLMGGNNAALTSTEVVRVGIYNNEKKYWPIKVRVIGSCKLNDPFNQGKTVSFNKIGDFVLFRDDYGDWQAELRGGMFQ